MFRKKYFSPDERLYIVQHAAAQQRKKQKQRKEQACHPSSLSTDLAAPEPNDLAEPRQTKSHAVQRRSIKIQSDLGQITVDQAYWFFGLPEKARKQYFSKEENEVLDHQCHKALAQLPPLPKTSFFESQGVPLKSVDAAGELDGREETMKIAHGLEGEKHAVNKTSPLLEPSETNDTEMSLIDVYARRRSSAATLTMPPPPPRSPPQPPASASQQRQENPQTLRRRSKVFHRRLSLQPVALPPPTLAPAPPMLSPPTLQNFAFSPRLSRPPDEPTPQAPDEIPDARHWQDPEARQQLRRVLSSQQHFDDAIEFGFPSPDFFAPSSSGTDGSVPAPKAPSPYSDCDASSMDSRGPPTPIVIPQHRPEHDCTVPESFDSGVALPLQRNTNDKAPPSPTFAREGTIRMTLTRPDMRSAEKVYNTGRVQHSGLHLATPDPLALEDLSVCEDHTGAHGAFARREAQQGKGLKKVWKTLRKHVHDH